MAEILGGSRHIVLAREVTKIHEEFLRGRADEVLRSVQNREAVKGEITLLIGRAEEADVAEAAVVRETVRQRIEQLMAAEEIDEKSALKRVAKERGVSKSEIYREMQKGR